MKCSFENNQNFSNVCLAMMFIHNWSYFNITYDYSLNAYIGSKYSTCLLLRQSSSKQDLIKVEVWSINGDSIFAILSKKRGCAGDLGDNRNSLNYCSWHWNNTGWSLPSTQGVWNSGLDERSQLRDDISNKVDIGPLWSRPWFWSWLRSFRLLPPSCYESFLNFSCFLVSVNIISSVFYDDKWSIWINIAVLSGDSSSVSGLIVSDVSLFLFIRYLIFILILRVWLFKK